MSETSDYQRLWWQKMDIIEDMQEELTQLIYTKKMEVSLLGARFKDVMFAQVVAARGRRQKRRRDARDASPLLSFEC